MTSATLESLDVQTTLLLVAFEGEIVATNVSLSPMDKRSAASLSETSLTAICSTVAPLGSKVTTNSFVAWLPPKEMVAVNVTCCSISRKVTSPVVLTALSSLEVHDIHAPYLLVEGSSRDSVTADISPNVSSIFPCCTCFSLNDCSYTAAISSLFSASP
ncbi:hypothetical protein D3C74_361400 [compost metagenome]